MFNITFKLCFAKIYVPIVLPQTEDDWAFETGYGSSHF